MIDGRDSRPSGMDGRQTCDAGERRTSPMPLISVSIGLSTRLEREPFGSSLGPKDSAPQSVHDAWWMCEEMPSGQHPHRRLRGRAGVAADGVRCRRAATDNNGSSHRRGSHNVVHHYLLGADDPYHNAGCEHHHPGPDDHRDRAQHHDHRGTDDHEAPYHHHTSDAGRDRHPHPDR